MDTRKEYKRTSGSGSPSDDEKYISNKHEVDMVGMPPDPDDGLSAEEREKIVRSHSTPVEPGTHRSIGSQALVEARPHSHPLAMSPVSHQFPRPDKYRQCKDPRSTEGPQDDKQSIQLDFDHFLHLLLRLRASYPDPSQEVQALDFPAHDHDTLGYLHDDYGSCAQLLGSDGCPVCSEKRLHYLDTANHACSWFLGLTEAGLFPGVNYYLSCWYKRSEFGIRAAIFFSAAALAGSFGGLLAAAIAQMHGIGGKAGWAWIFILEGLVTLAIGVASFWMVHDFPDEATFLSEDDRRRVIRRLKEDKQSSAEHEAFKMAYVWASLKDWKTYTGMMIYMGADGALYAVSVNLLTSETTF